MALTQDGNKAVLNDWIAKWRPLADKAIDAYCKALPESAGSAEQAKSTAKSFRAGLGLNG